MTEYMSKERFLRSMGLDGDETKYGNRDAEHQHKSYSTWMGYEIMDSVDDSIVEDAVEVVRCKDCKHWKPSDAMAGNLFENMEPIGGCRYVNFCRKASDFCSYGERRNDEAD